ncbi:Chitinase domain-containing protein [Drosera capensis]
MTKKRDRGPTNASTRQRHRVNSPPPKPATISSPQCRSLFSDHRFIIVLFFIASSAVSILLFNRTIPLSSPQNPKLVPWVHRNGLVKEDVDWREIVDENAEVEENATGRNFRNPVLAYVTPWNSAGYDLAKKFFFKFTHISPVWYDLKSQGSKLVLEGRHNADTGWISDLRSKGDVQVLPRVVLEMLPADLLRMKKQMAKTIDLIVRECKDMDYDGIVLESWSRWAAHGVLQDAAMRNKALSFLKQLGETLHNVTSDTGISKHLQLVYVIGPPRSEMLHEYDFGPEDLRTLSEAVDGFSLMTYDFSNPYSPGPNAPLKWIRSTLQLILGSAGKGLAGKIFVGINFYGYNYLLEGGGAEAVIGRDYLSLLKQHNPSIRWEKNSAEHFFLYHANQRQHAVFYPSLMSISERLKEARSWGAGISIWEIGQGLDYFFDLL